MQVPTGKAMRIFSILVTIIFAQMFTSAAFAESIWDKGNWYVLSRATDGSETVYMRKDMSLAPDDSGRTLVALMFVETGPDVKALGGVFAQYTVVSFDCGENTMATVSYRDFNRLGVDIAHEEYDVDYDSFQPINDPKVDTAHSVACSTIDPKTLGTTGDVSVVQLIETGIAGYDKQTGQAFAY